MACDDALSASVTDYWVGPYLSFRTETAISTTGVCLSFNRSAAFNYLYKAMKMAFRM